jgi:hypothetical protein
MSDPTRPKSSDRPIVIYFKKLFCREPQAKPASANETLQPWLEQLKQHLHLYLQTRYLDKQPGFFTNLFADSQKQAAFNRLLFSSNNPESFAEIILHPHLIALWSTSQGRLAVHATYFSIIKPLEEFDPTILNKPATNPECNALLQQLLKNFTKICSKLAKTHDDEVLLPLLKDSYLQLAVVANQPVEDNADESLSAIYQAMQTKVDAYLLKHPRKATLNKDKAAANDSEDAVKHVVGNTVQFP